MNNKQYSTILLLAICLSFVACKSSPENNANTNVATPIPSEDQENVIEGMMNEYEWLEGKWETENEEPSSDYYCTPAGQSDSCIQNSA